MKSVVFKILANLIEIETSPSRPKSAPYLRLKKTRKRKPLFLQLETTKALEKLKSEKKIPNFFLKFPVSRIVPKNVKGGTLWDFLNIHSVAKHQKLMGGTIKKFGKKLVSQCQKKEESLIVSKKVDPSALEWHFISC